MANLDKSLNGLPRERAAIMAAVNAWMGKLGLSKDYSINSHEDKWLSFDPVAELVGMVGEEKVVVVTP